jgi:hypothetical protein
VARAIKDTDMASYVAKALSLRAGSDATHSPAAIKAVRVPNMRFTARYWKVVAPNIKTSDSSRAAASPPIESAIAPSGE